VLSSVKKPWRERESCQKKERRDIIIIILKSNKQGFGGVFVFVAKTVERERERELSRTNRN